MSSSTPKAEAPLGEWRGFRLLDFQVRAIQALRAGANVLVSAPTGAGKTLVAEYAIADAVARGRRCVYTAPVKALSNQKYRDFRDDPDVDVGLMTGDVTIAPHAQVLIMTTEILRNAILEDPAALADVDFVILDEVHYMDDIERGSVWEESLIFAPPQIRFVALSATVKNLDQLGAWVEEIREHELVVIHSTRRPVPLKHRVYTPTSGIFDPGRIETIRKLEAKLGDSDPKQDENPWGRKSRGRPGGRRGGRERVRRGGSTGQLMQLFGTLSRDDKFPALVFSFSRKDCERLALAAAKKELLNDEERGRMEVLQRELIDLFQLNPEALVGEVFSLARRGIGYHHAGMLPLHKEVVERMFTSGLIKLLFTTETFAIGINMPARTVVFTSLRKFDGVTFDYLRTRDYMQMAGRAGRQGIDDMGLVVSYLDERDLQEAPVTRIVSGKPEPVESRFRLTYATILHLIEHLGRERLVEAWEKSFNQFQHRGRSRKARESNKAVQRALVDAHIQLLCELNYLDKDFSLTARGRVARLFYGYELQVTELLFQGVLEELPGHEIAQVFVGLVHSARRRERVRVPHRFFGDLRHEIDGIIRVLGQQEIAAGLTNPLKEADWGLAPAIDLWIRGSELEELGDEFEGTSGDVVRTMRQSLQLMRQVRRTLDPKDALSDRIAEAVQCLNREEVDAQRQLELG